MQARNIRNGARQKLVKPPAFAPRKPLATGERRDALPSKTGDLGTQGSDEFQPWDEVHRFGA